MAKFKVGDRVVRTVSFPNSVVPVGYVDVVNYVSQCGNSIALKGVDFTYNPNNFELYKEPEVTQETKKPHVHAELIKAWADGAIIQRKLTNNDWLDIDNPGWVLGVEYRIKPEVKPDFYRYGIVHTETRPKGSFPPDDYCAKFAGLYSKAIEGVNIKLTFDGKTGKLKEAEAID